MAIISIKNPDRISVRVLEKILITLRKEGEGFKKYCDEDKKSIFRLLCEQYVNSENREYRQQLYFIISEWIDYIFDIETFYYCIERHIDYDDLAMLLIKTYSKIRFSETKYKDRTPLFHAIERKNTSWVSGLVNQLKGDNNTTCMHGISPMELAIERRDKKIQKILAPVTKSRNYDREKVFKAFSALRNKNYSDFQHIIKSTNITPWINQRDSGYHTLIERIFLCKREYIYQHCTALTKHNGIELPSIDYINRHCDPDIKLKMIRLFISCSSANQLSDSDIIDIFKIMLENNLYDELKSLLPTFKERKNIKILLLLCHKKNPEIIDASMKKMITSDDLEFSRLMSIVKNGRENEFPSHVKSSLLNLVHYKSGLNLLNEAIDRCPRTSIYIKLLEVGSDPNTYIKDKTALFRIIDAPCIDDNRKVEMMTYLLNEGKADPEKTLRDHKNILLHLIIESFNDPDCIMTIINTIHQYHKTYLEKYINSYYKGHTPLTLSSIKAKSISMHSVSDLLRKHGANDAKATEYNHLLRPLNISLHNDQHQTIITANKPQETMNHRK